MVSPELLGKIKESLGVQYLKPTSQGGGGCISTGHVYNTDTGKLYLKINKQEGAEVMFRGEMASLRAIEATGTVCVPKAHLVVVDCPAAGKPSGAVLVLDYLELQGEGGDAALGAQLADLHLHNLLLRDSSQSRIGSTGSSDVGSGSGSGSDGSYVAQFGFAVPTCCGYLPQDNTWCDDWQVFMARKLEWQLNRLQSKGRSGRQAVELWPVLQRLIPSLFSGTTPAPSLLHGDLWSGNVDTIRGVGGRAVPVVLDAASFYGHDEYDLALAGMFGGFSDQFWTAYHAKIPKREGWSRRQLLYQLFHYLNHWNHFGSGYSGSSLQIMRKLVG